jgi:hypothetical protein
MPSQKALVEWLKMVERLPSKPEALTSNPSTTKKKKRKEKKKKENHEFTSNTIPPTPI